MHGIWKQEGMKEVTACDQRRQIEEKYWIEELEMETSKQKIERQSNKDTEMAPVIQIVTKQEYMELFGTESNDKTFDGDGDWSGKYRGDTRDTELWQAKIIC